MSTDTNLIGQFVAESSDELGRALSVGPAKPRPTRQCLLAAIENVSKTAAALGLEAFAPVLAHARDAASDLDALTTCCKAAVDYLEQLRATGAIEARDLTSDNDPAIGVFAPDADEPEVELAAPESAEWTELAPRGQDDVDQTLLDAAGIAPVEKPVETSEAFHSHADELDVLATLGLHTPADASPVVPPAPEATPPTSVNAFDETEFLAHLDAVMPTDLTPLPAVEAPLESVSSTVVQEGSDPVESAEPTPDLAFSSDSVEIPAFSDSAGPVEAPIIAGRIEPVASVKGILPTDSPDYGVTDQVVRLDLARVEELLGVVSQLVMCKNQICALLRESGSLDAKRQDAGHARSASIEIDRLTARLQAGLLQARTLPLARLFDRFPKLVRETALAQGKEIELTLHGQETQVDKRVMDLLAEPLAHVLKFRAANGFENPDIRALLGKPRAGTMRLEADNQDSHVLVRVWDDGLVLHRDAVQKQVIDARIVAPERAREMEDADLFALVLHPAYPGSGSATASSNLEQLNAQVRVLSSQGRGTVFEIFFPLNVGIMSAMLARVDGEVYAIPQKTVMEVARLKPDQQFPVCKQPSMFLREQVVQLVDLTSALHGKSRQEAERVAIVVQVGDQRAGLLVDEVLGQQQVVIKELDATCNHSDLFSGATLLEDGRVGLILNVVKLLRTHSARPALKQAA